jgi:hypothetical protein
LATAQNFTKHTKTQAIICGFVVVAQELNRVLHQQNFLPTQRLLAKINNGGFGPHLSERKMNIGKSYWAVSIRNKAAETSMPRKEYSEMRRALRAEASIVLNLNTELRKN